MWIVPPVAGLIEPAIAPEFYVDGIGAIEALPGGSVRIYLVSEQMPFEAVAGGSPEQVLMLKLRGPTSAIPWSIAQLAQCLWRTDTPPRNAGPPGLRLVT